MNYLQIKKAIQQKQLAPVYCLYGTQSYLVEDFIQIISNQVLLPEQAEMNIRSFNMDETPLEIAVEEAETIPFF